MANERQQETSVRLYSVSPQTNTENSYNSNRPVEDAFMFRSQSPDASVDYSGSIDVNQANATLDDSKSYAYNLGSIFNKKKFAWLLEVEDEGNNDTDMEKPLL